MKALLYVMPAVALLLTACGPSAPKQRAAVPVSVFEIQGTQSAYSKNYMGNISAKKNRAVLSLHDGTLTSISARVGSKVRENQALAVINSPNVMSLYRANQATLRQAQDGYDRAKKVYEAGGLSEIKWMEVQTKLAQATAAAEISQKSVDDCTIRAPFSGTINEVFASAGETVNPTSRLFSIIDESELEVAITIPENEYSSVKEGEEAIVIIPALDNLEIAAVITEIGVNASNISHTYKSNLALKSKPSSIKAGMACRVCLKSNLMNRIIVPANSVKTDDAGRYVWAVSKDSTVVKKRVRINGFVDNGIAISEGLDNGDMVIFKGMNKVSGGMKVIPIVEEIR